MKRRLRSIAFCIGLVLVGVVGGFQMRAQGQAGTAPQAPAPIAPGDTAAMRAQYEQWRKDYKTWGKWGTEDNKGTSNLITPQKVLSAMKLVKSGIVVSLAPPSPRRWRPTSARRHLPPRHERDHRRRHDRQLPGQLPRADRGAHRQLVPLLRERPDVQRHPGEGQPHARGRMQEGQRDELERRHLHARRPVRHRAVERASTGSTPRARSRARTSKRGRRSRV